MIDYKITGQRNPCWANHWLGNSRNSTIGNYGCLLTCYAMMAGVDPLTMNDVLVNNGGFVRDSAYMQVVVLPHVLDNRIVSYQGISGWYNDAVPTQQINILKSWLASDGNCAVILVDPTPGTPGLNDDEMHFILAVGLDDQQNIIVNDPWYSDRVNISPRYGRTPADAIYQWRLYRVTETAVHI